MADVGHVCHDRSSEYAVVKESFDQKHARQRAVLGKLQPQALVEALAAQAAQAEADADALQVGQQHACTMPSEAISLKLHIRMAALASCWICCYLKVIKRKPCCLPLPYLWLVSTACDYIPFHIVWNQFCSWLHMLFGLLATELIPTRGANK